MTQASLTHFPHPRWGADKHIGALNCCLDDFLLLAFIVSLTEYFGERNTIQRS